MIPTAESLLFQKVLTPSGSWPSKVTQVMLSEAILEMIKADLGIGVMSQWFTAPYVRTKWFPQFLLREMAWSVVGLERPSHEKTFLLTLRSSHNYCRIARFRHRPKRVDRRDRHKSVN
jgi:DNA-binding transcriptional LysR family regulator